MLIPFSSKKLQLASLFSENIGLFPFPDVGVCFSKYRLSSNPYIQRVTDPRLSEQLEMLLSRSRSDGLRSQGAGSDAK